MAKQILQIGDGGTEVETLQRVLVALGYQIIADGRFDANTQAAVMAFQQTHQDKDGAALVVDGIVGIKTWWAMITTGAGKQVVAPMPHPMLWVALALMAVGGYYFLYK